MSISERDLTGVVGAGKIPVIAVLTFPDPNAKWIFAEATKLRSGR